MDRLEIKEKLYKFLGDTLGEPWMDDYSFERKMIYCLNEQGESLDSVVEKIQIGVKNGYDVDFQLKIMYGLVKS